MSHVENLRRKLSLFIFVPVVVLAVLSLIVALLFPTFLGTLFQLFGIFLVLIFIVFVALGIMVIFGLRREVTRIINRFVEGTLQIIEIVRFITLLWQELVTLVQETLLYLSPVFAITSAAAIYWLALAFYKFVGKANDLTLVTVFLTILLSAVLNLISEGSKGRVAKPGFGSRFKERIRLHFLNAFEIMLLVFFLTLDWQNPFFIPQTLWGPLRAKVGSLDLMAIGANWHEEFIATFWLAGMALLLELIRRIMRVLAATLEHYRDLRAHAAGSRLVQFEEALQFGFSKNIDDLIKFLGFMTVIILAFFLLPRLKILSMIAFSLTNLVWDLAEPTRLSLGQEPPKDFLSNLVVKVFRL